MTKKFGLALLASVVVNGVAITIAKTLDEHDPESKAIATNIIGWSMVAVYIACIVVALISTIGVIASFLMDLGEKRALSRS